MPIIFIPHSSFIIHHLPRSLTMPNRKFPRRRRRAGFTLMEVLLVMVIIVMLGAFVGVAIRNAQGQANVNAAKAQIQQLQSPLDLYRLNINSYPSTSQGLAALEAAPGDIANQSKWQGPYLDKPVPLDPWDNPYQYMSPGNRNADYDLWSFGPDGQDGTADDIGNWPAEGTSS
jgi:general secretion pathway protein G